MTDLDNLRERIYTLTNPETAISGDAWESTALIGGPHGVDCDDSGACRRRGDLAVRTAELAGEAEALADFAEGDAPGEPPEPSERDATGPDPDLWPEAIPIAKAVIWPRRLLLAAPELAGADVRFAFLPRGEIERRSGRKAAALHDWRPSGRHLIAVADDLDPDDLERLLAHEIGHARHAHYIGEGFARTSTERAEVRAKAAENDGELRATIRGAITARRGAANSAREADPFAPIPRASRVIRRDQATAIQKVKG